MKYLFFSLLSFLQVIYSHEGNINDLNNNIIYPNPSPINNFAKIPYPKYISNLNVEEHLPQPRPKLRANYKNKENFNNKLSINEPLDESLNENKQVAIYYKFNKRNFLRKPFIKENVIEYNYEEPYSYDKIPRMPLI